jgi:hypothetical protein
MVGWATNRTLVFASRKLHRRKNMNLQKVSLSFDFEHWTDDNFRWGDTPQKISEWCVKHFPHNHKIVQSESEDLHFDVTLYNVPHCAISLIGLTTNNVSILETTEFSPIHPEVYELFDFGDLK